MRLRGTAILGFAGMIMFLAGCTPSADQGTTTAKSKEDLIPFEKYTLDNGLEVILHEDKSDPIVAVAIQYHVGSNREVKGRTGFAHLFEHMLFQESKNVAKDQFFKNIQGAGGTLNGGTWKDGTVYYEVVPNNALEMVLWMESDRMGYLLSTVNQASFANQQDVVQNEKRQRVDNQPYGHTNYVIDSNLYPENHPYNWQVIGSFEDLKSATLQDIHDFFYKWYGPNNATLVIAGDYDKAQTKAWVEKYFGDLKAFSNEPDPKPMPVSLAETKKVYHEDNFAKSPELNMVFPSIHQFQKDAYALDALADLLADGKKAPLYKILVEEKELAPSVGAFQNSGEVAGSFRIRIRTFPDKNLTAVEQSILEAFERFERDGFSEGDLERIKIKAETDFYNGLSSVLSKSFQLAQYNEYAGSPEFVTTELKNIQSVTSEDVMRVYETYIKGKNYVLTSFVPKGQAELVADGSVLFPVVEEDFSKQDDSVEVSETPDIEVTEAPSSFDRSVKPSFGPDPVLSSPTVWHADMSNGMNLLGIEQRELPLVEFMIVLKGGMLLDDINKIGVANLVSDMMMEGTANKTPIELEEAIDQLGANIRMVTGDESISLWVNTLKSKFPETLALVEEILLEPRWDEKEFARVKRETIENIQRSEAQPNRVATNVFNKLVYGPKHHLAYSTLGSKSSVESITLEDLKTYYSANFSPKVAHIAVVGDIGKQEAEEAFQSLAGKWQGAEVSFPELPATPAVDNTRLYFVDMPKAKQSVIRIGYLAVPYNHEDYYKAVVMNYRLGGSFNSILNMILREEKGYTYGARSFFSGTSKPGPFVASSSVQSNATYPSVEIFRDEINKYREGISETELEFTRNALVKSNARAFETLGALRTMLSRIANYDLSDDYIKQQEKVALEMTLEEHKVLAQKYLPREMIYLVVGDAETQMAPLEKLGLGKPIQLDKDGNLITGSEQGM